MGVYAYEYDTEPITECWIEFPTFTTQQCNHKASATTESNAFAAHGAPEMNRINDIMQDRVEALWQDNTAHADTIAKEAAQLYRTYDYCLQSLCNQILSDCRAANLNQLARENAQRCELRRQRLLSIQEANLTATTHVNLNRKADSLFIEKMSQISLHFDQWLHPRLTAVSKNLAEAEKTIIALARAVWKQ